MYIYIYILIYNMDIYGYGITMNYLFFLLDTFEDTPIICQRNLLFMLLLKVRTLPGLRPQLFAQFFGGSNDKGPKSHLILM